MKAILFGLMIFLSTSLRADWHSWEESTPKEGDLYMVVHMVAGNPIEERQTLIVDTWRKKDGPILDSGYNGWWDVTPRSLWKWLHEGSKLIYVPSGLASINYLQQILETEGIGPHLYPYDPQ